MKIAIVGAGISGLAAAHRLHANHDLAVFEANGAPGGHANTVEVEHDGRRLAIDAGFIVFNDWTYPNFIALLDELGVESQPTEMGFSVRDDRTGLEYNGNSLNTLFVQRRNLLSPRFYRMLADILRFNAAGKRLADDGRDATTVAEFLARGRYSQAFADCYLLPMGAAIWSCPTGTFGQFPIRFVAEFYARHGLLNVFRRPTWRVVRGGSRTYVTALVRPFRDRLRLNCPVVAVRRRADRVEVQPRGGPPEAFDHVVLACHSDQALRILGDGATPAEREALGACPYQRNVAVLHTDVAMLPRARRAWAAWNYRLGSDPAAPPTVTYNMNILQRLDSSATFCVTLNDEAAIDPTKIIARFDYSHPTFAAGRAAAQSRRAELLAANRTSFCGAYWGCGFHEDGVVSGIAAADALAKSASRSPVPAGAAG